jgi:hypothetical protein
MDQPYPDGAQKPRAQQSLGARQKAGAQQPSGPQQPPTPAPGPVRSAVMSMYAGAAASVVLVIADLVTRAELRSYIASRSRTAGAHPTASQITATTTTALAAGVVVGVISIGLWIFIARAAGKGSNRARITGTVLFGLDTVALLAGPPDIGVSGPTWPKIFTGLVWVAGLVAVILLWRRSSRAFFTGGPN